MIKKIHEGKHKIKLNQNKCRGVKKVKNACAKRHRCGEVCKLQFTLHIHKLMAALMTNLNCEERVVIWTPMVQLVSSGRPPCDR